MKVYLLWHTHDLAADADDKPDEDAKLLGVYSSGLAAQARIVRARQLPGFRDSPDGFEVSEYTVDEDGWSEGYTTV
ncbi:hypothetical protein KGQ20_02470 [Catenulispora sp. NF23]|uniref:DUF7336 domain-containing protein n=1 Tax=Catenulispora pinistramenti TaxID=2705254 RepID=UPI001BA92A0E|nr:hypothetical protein [Catenulispora pinistramenti]MBS2531630.1 hypothetical protein [Catenulispora pinistramenti]